MPTPERTGTGSGPTLTQQQEQQKAMASQSSFMLIMMMFMMILIFDPGLRDGMGNLMGTVLQPTIGMDYSYPVWSIFAAGVIMVMFSTTVRHVLVDWMKVARIQKKMGAFQKELRKARLENNQGRLNRLMEMQPDIMIMQSDMSASQMKPMFITMLVAIPIFMWIRQFVDGLDLHAISLPWESYWNLKSSKGTLLPHWIIIYSALSIPLGQAYRRTLLTLKYRKKLALSAATVQERADEAIRKAEKRCSGMAQEGLPVDDMERRLEKARKTYGKKDYEAALRTVKAVKRDLNRLERDHGEALRHLESARTIRKAVGTGVAGVEDMLGDADEKLSQGDFESSIYYSKKAKRELLKAKEKIELKEGRIDQLEKKLGSMEKNTPLLNLDRAFKCLRDAKESDSGEIIEEHLDQAEREIKAAEKQLESTINVLESARNMLDRARDAGVMTDDLEKEIGAAEVLHERRNQREAGDIAREVKESAIRFRKAAESVEKTMDDARLEILNAKNLDLDVVEAESLLKKAETFADSRKHEDALEYARKAADEAKRVMSGSGN